MGVSVLSGLVNVALDWLFVVELHAGTAGAALLLWRQSGRERTDGAKTGTGS